MFPKLHMLFHESSVVFFQFNFREGGEGYCVNFTFNFFDILAYYGSSVAKMKFILLC